MKDKTLNKAARYIIFRDMEVIVNTGLLIFISFAYLLGIYKLLLRARGEEFIILMTYAFVLGFGILGSNTILVKLSLRDKLSGRLEFLLGTGLDVKEIIKAYSIENWRLSSLPSFVIFFGTYLICDLGKSFVALYLSCIILHYFLILTLNVIAMYRKNFKFFKNLIYFSTSLLIYLFGVFSKKIILIFERQNLDVNIFILGINIFATIVLAAYSFYQIKKMDNESVMEVKSVWS
mgnify:CR=1 FL=1